MRKMNTDSSPWLAILIGAAIVAIMWLCAGCQTTTTTTTDPDGTITEIAQRVPDVQLIAMLTASLGEYVMLRETASTQWAAARYEGMIAVIQEILARVAPINAVKSATTGGVEAAVNEVGRVLSAQAVGAGTLQERMKAQTELDGLRAIVAEWVEMDLVTVQ